MEQIIKSVKPTLSATSLKNYITNINKLHKSLQLKDTDITNLNGWIFKRDKIMDFINSLKTPNTRKTYISNMITLLKYNQNQNQNDKYLSFSFTFKIDKYNTELQYYIQLAKDNQKNIAYTQKTNNPLEEKVISMTEYNKLISLTETDYPREHLQFSILKEQPIRNELSSLILIKNADYTKLSLKDRMENNYLVLGQKIRIVRGNYKTAKLYGIKDKEITNKKLKSLIRKYIKDNNIIFNSPLFIYKDKPQSQNDISQRLSYVSNKLINVKLSTSSIFKIILNEVRNRNIDNQEKVDIITELGKIRGTDFTTLNNYYVFGKIDKLDNDSE
tara:strand:+ start:139 stop:1128 length:990 start_codon:yes stop_codon:yes gene_type:complete